MKRSHLLFTMLIMLAPARLYSDVFCNICEHSAKTFASYGVTKKPNRCCQKCNSLERQRYLWYFLQTEKAEIFTNNITLLHWAPDRCIGDKLKRLPTINYIGGDLYPELWKDPKVIKLDITQINLPENFIDVTICSHVMEHIIDDQLAMREVYRVLKPGGYALFIVPVFDYQLEKTYEDFTITDPEQRLEHFGQSDHVRKYVSSDFEARLRKAGFEVQPFPVKKVPTEIAKKYMMSGGDDAHERSGSDVYLCTKKK